MGPFWASVSNDTKSFVLVIFFSTVVRAFPPLATWSYCLLSWPAQSAHNLQMHLGMLGTTNAALALEDPFDNQGLDGVYVAESFYEVEQV